MNGFDESEDLSWLLEVHDPTTNNEKFQCITENEDDETHKTMKLNNIDVPAKITVNTRDNCQALKSMDSNQLYSLFDKLQDQAQSNKDMLRKLRLAKTYRQKNDLKTVEALIFKWKKATQLALEELLQFAPKEPATTMDHLLAHLGIDAETVGFNPSDQTFLR